MSNLVISLSILILIQIINRCGSIPFFLQNSKGSYSWLFYLNNSIKTSNLPNCFLQLWDYFSCIYKVIKHHPLVETGYIYFKQNFKPFETEKKFPPILSFYSNFFYPLGLFMIFWLQYLACISYPHQKIQSKIAGLLWSRNQKFQTCYHRMVKTTPNYLDYRLKYLVQIPSI
jgi:hypothetical protein